MPRHVDHDVRRAEIAELAARLIADHGPDGVSLRSLAAAGGFSTTAVTHYFASKKELLLQAYSAAVAHASARIAAIPEDEPDSLLAYAQAVLPLDEPRRQDWRTWLAFFGAAVGDPELAALQRRRVTSFRALLRRCIEADQSSERLGDEIDAERHARMLLALIHGIAIEAAVDPGDWPPSRQLALLADQLASIRSHAGDVHVGA